MIPLFLWIAVVFVLVGATQAQDAVRMLLERDPGTENLPVACFDRAAPLSQRCKAASASLSGFAPLADQPADQVIGLVDDENFGANGADDAGGIEGGPSNSIAAALEIQISCAVACHTIEPGAEAALLGLQKEIDDGGKVEKKKKKRNNDEQAAASLCAGNTDAVRALSPRSLRAERCLVTAHAISRALRKMTATDWPSSNGGGGGEKSNHDRNNEIDWVWVHVVGPGEVVHDEPVPPPSSDADIDGNGPVAGGKRRAEVEEETVEYEVVVETSRTPDGPDTPKLLVRSGHVPCLAIPVRRGAHVSLARDIWPAIAWHNVEEAVEAQISRLEGLIQAP